MSHVTSLALLVGRWGSWPGWTPLLLRSFAANPTIDFFCLSDVWPAPQSRLPANVRYFPLTLDQLLTRLRAKIGVKLTSLTASGSFGPGVSSAKTNDFKPMWGVLFADLLSRHKWWGYLQEDLVLGDLRAWATEALLARSDVICPFLPPLNSSGVLMLFRNVESVNLLWRASSALQRVLTSKQYLVFDEWWGPLAGFDNFARVLGRHSAEGQIRLSLANSRRRWMSDDKRYGAGAASTNEDFSACWHRGRLWAPTSLGPTPCHTDSSSGDEGSSGGEISNGNGGGQGSDGNGGGQLASGEVALVHLSRVKRTPQLAHLVLRGLEYEISRTERFAITFAGVWLPEPACVSNPAWRNPFGIGCSQYEEEGHCAAGRFVRGHEWSGGPAFGWPERECCVCGKPNGSSSSGGSGGGGGSGSGGGGGIGGGGSHAGDGKHKSQQTLWLSGEFAQIVETAAVSRFMRALAARDAAARCNLSPAHQVRMSEGRMSEGRTSEGRTSSARGELVSEPNSRSGGKHGTGGMSSSKSGSSGSSHSKSSSKGSSSKGSNSKGSNSKGSSGSSSKSSSRSSSGSSSSGSSSSKSSRHSSSKSRSRSTSTSEGGRSLSSMVAATGGLCARRVADAQRADARLPCVLRLAPGTETSVGGSHLHAHSATMLAKLGAQRCE